MSAFLNGLDEIFSRYSAEDVDNFLPLVYRHAFRSPAEMPPAARRLLERFQARLGVSTRPSPQELESAVRRHYEQHPLNPALLREVNQLIKSDTLLGAQDPAKAGKVFQGFAELPTAPPEPVEIPEDAPPKVDPKALLKFNKV
jgi:hypothetical protein